jgi:uncharacterized protein (TIGR03435 family)
MKRASLRDLDMRALILFAALTPVIVLAQSPPSGSDLRYEVVSIKRNTSGNPGPNGSIYRPDGGITFIYTTTINLLTQSFLGFGPSDMVGLPDWVMTDRYDVSTVSLLSRRATDEERAAMIRALLADRFKLVAHIEKRELDAYDLVFARSDHRLGAGITPSEVDCEAQFAANRAAREAALAAGNPPPRPALATGQLVPCGGMALSTAVQGDMTMNSLAALLRSAAGRPVVNKTGLNGYYRIQLHFAAAFSASAPGAAASTNDLPDIFSALPAQLGLKLEPSKTERDKLVIERIERPRIENLAISRSGHLAIGRSRQGTQSSDLLTVCGKVRQLAVVPAALAHLARAINCTRMGCGSGVG